jgi:hypothetical protein
VIQNPSLNTEIELDVLSGEPIETGEVVTETDPINWFTIQNERKIMVHEKWVQ